jgi:hypothetical protein
MWPWVCALGGQQAGDAYPPLVGPRCVGMSALAGIRGVRAYPEAIGKPA